jgi:hypothetical protein
MLLKAIAAMLSMSDARRDVSHGVQTDLRRT